MDERINEERLPGVDVRPNAGIVRSPLDEIRAIRNLLADVYKDAGDGRTLFRELVQNADDAQAQRLALVVLERGWPDARNALHRNDGGRYPDRYFEDEIISDDRSWSVVGIEARGSESLRQLRSRSDWPQSPKWENGRYSSEPRKALAHAAVTVLQPSDLEADLSGARLRWAVFLPLDDDPEPRSSAIVESKGPSPAWEIILHGYFWPSQDRRSIPGVTEEIGNPAGDDGMRVRWNWALCEALLLPLLPSALANAVAGVDERAAERVLHTVVRADMVKNRLAEVIRRNWLLPVVTACGVRWKARDANSIPVLSIPQWSQAPECVRTRFVASCDECTDDVEFIDDAAPRLAGELGDWTDDRLERLPSCIPVDAFGSPQSLR